MNRIKWLEDAIVKTDAFIIRLEARKKKMSEELLRKKTKFETKLADKVIKQPAA